ncbi:C6 transcription factor [Paecilomyces variotii No. 5]|uniref:C6 transcription factor n=1 Tax=Byssochlamys spectabilis (strain No. 5 / NBRC 109023) TaxID=1356009 RepID=V5FNH7_BYSSN|nr:C6 transcription factor [Paecilomyces variotii No. 5]
MEEGPELSGPRRKRVSRACDRCRSKKDKCDGIRPTCSACQSSGHVCSYDPHAKKRGLPEGYVRGLEKLWALSLCNIEGLEDTMLHMLGVTAESAIRRPQLMSLWTDDSAAESLHETWKSSKLYAALEKMLTNQDTDRTRSFVKRPRDHNDEEWGFRVARYSTSKTSNAPRVVNPTDPPPPKRPRHSFSTGTDRDRPLTPGPQPLQLPPQASQLLEWYFARTHIWFPIIAKHNVLKASYVYPTAPFSAEKYTSGSGDHAALWAILSYTVAQQCPPQAESPDGTENATSAKVQEYYKVARSLIPSEKEKLEIGHIQALLLLTMVNMGTEEWTAAWLLSGQATRMAVAMGLGGSHPFSQKPSEIKQGKTVFLGCFVIDSLLAVRLSRCPCMRPEDLAKIGPLEEDGLEEWNPWVDVLCPSGESQPHGPNIPQRGPLLALSCFNRLIELAAVLNKIARDLPPENHEQTLTQRILRDLMQWDERLPSGCRLVGAEGSSSDDFSALLPHQTYLALTYAATLMALYSRFATGERGYASMQRLSLHGTKKALYRIVPVLSQHVQNFKSCGLPPIFEFALHSIVEKASNVREKLELEDFPFSSWMETLIQGISEVGHGWPAFRSLTTSIKRGALLGDTSRLPAVAQRRMTSPEKSVQDVWNPLPTRTGAADGTRLPGKVLDNPIPLTSKASFPRKDNTSTDFTSSVMGISIPVDSYYLTPQNSATDDVDMSFLSGLYSRPLDPPVNVSKTLPQTSPDARLGSGAQAHPQSPDSSATNAPKPSSSNNVPYGTGRGSQNTVENPSPNYDLDSIFNDLAYLDTNEWANNREEALEDFGFIDDSTFHAFCNDPDRLIGSQPLVDRQSIADIWPPPGFFPEAFQGNPGEG